MISGARGPALNRDRHYLYVIGPNVSEIVGHIGGWLFDRAMAGWDVTVFVRDFQNAWPLRILGVRADDYESAIASIRHCPGRAALAVAAEAYDDDASVRELVRTGLDDYSCEVTIWGGHRPTGLSTGLPLVSHRLGPGAAAFKQHALAAAAVGALPAGGPEVFYSNCAQSARRAIVHTSARSLAGASRGKVSR